MVMNSDQKAMVEACREALADGTFRKLTLSARGKHKRKLAVELVAGETKNLMRISHDGKPGESEAMDGEAIIALMQDGPVFPFRAATLFTTTADLHYAENRKQESRLYRTRASLTDAPPTHNRQKQYALKADRPYLRSLGITGADGKVIKKQHPKFRQIANFVEIIDRDIGDFVTALDRPVSMMDLGSGKGYLTFAIHDYIRSRAKHEPHGRGVDLKADMIALCNDLSAQLGFEGLSFINAHIDPRGAGPLDLLIALHACDTATDDALALGVRSDAQFLFCAPCCQAEIARQIGEPSRAYAPITRFNLMKRRQADILTDVCRAQLLEAVGYETRFLEFTPLEHTAKNIMLTGRKSDRVDRQKAFADYLALKKESGFSRHSLEENLKDLLPTD